MGKTEGCVVVLGRCEGWVEGKSVGIIVGHDVGKLGDAVGDEVGNVGDWLGEYVLLYTGGGPPPTPIMCVGGGA